MAHSVLHRTLRILNTLIATAAVALLGAVWWYAYRPLAQTSGMVDAPLTAAARVARDERGVPHVRASSEEDALFVQGYVTAQDRLFQMDGLRRLAGGTLAEVTGPSGIESDQNARRLRMRRIAEAAYPQLSAADRAALAAYARGVNEFIATHAGNLPVEFSLLRYQPRPWSVVDSLLVGLYMFRDLTTTWREELVKRNMLAAGDARKVEFLFPARTGGEVQPGSNAWVLAGSRTASGRPLLSNDMHLAWSLPGIWYMTHLEAPGLDVTGVALPGVPGVIVGHNRRIAWGITNLHFDVQDLYLEKFDDRSGRYLFRGQVEQARAEREIIRVKGAGAIEMPLWVTRHGPVLTDGAERLALRWAAAEPDALQLPILDIDRAQNWEQFQTALSRFRGPGSNFVYADVDGNIGYHAAGMLPIRRHHRGDVPVDGSSGDFEWEGFIPFAELPSAYNPKDGLIVSANQNPFPADYPHSVNGNFAPYYRARQIRDILGRRNGWKAADMLRVQTDVYSTFSKFLATQMVAAYKARNAHNPALEDAVQLLAAWDGQMDQKLAAPFLVALAFQHIRLAAAENAAPGKGSTYESPIAPAVIEKLLRERPGGWFADYDATLLRVLADAVEEGRRMQGRDVKKWLYGQYLKVRIDNPVTHQLPSWLAARFDIGPVAMSGSGTTVKQTSWRLGPSMRMNADLADWERSLLNGTIGQSGQPLSSHYSDEWADYYWGRSYPMPFARVMEKSVLEFRPSK